MLAFFFLQISGICSQAVDRPRALKEWSPPFSSLKVEAAVETVPLMMTKPAEPMETVGVPEVVKPQEIKEHQP